MAKGDDALVKKKNKSNRKKMNRKNDTATVSARIASIIAAKKRRKTGKRSMCQGMCYSLPTLEDPLNERQGKPEKKIAKKLKTKDAAKEKGSSKSVGRLKDNQKPVDEKMKGPPKFLMLCLNEIESSFRRDGLFSEDHHEKALFTNTWGIEFWKCFMSGKDVLVTSGTSSTVEQIAWIVSTAADAIARREKDDDELFSNSPFLLYLVPSQSKAAEARSVCKALKGLGIHTVSVHQGASLDHQIAGLKSCEPEFLISTPERLLEIVTLKGIDISRVSLLVIDELGSLCDGGYLDAVKSIKKAISCTYQTIVFNDSVSASHVPAIQSLLRRPYRKVSGTDSVASKGSGVIEMASEDKVVHW